MSYCEIPEFYSESFPKARKQYKCIECSAPIFKGEKHLSFCLKFDNEFQSGRQHLLCRKACMFIRDYFQGNECIGFGELKEYWKEYAYDSPKDRTDEIKKFRSLMANIINRERNDG